MTSRQARTERRAAERKARKAEIKRQKAAALAAARLAIPKLTLEADEAAHLSEPKTQANEAARLSEPKTQPDEAAHLSEPKTQANEAAHLSVPKTQIDEAAHLSEPKTNKEFSPELIAEANAARERIHRAAGIPPLDRARINRENAAHSTGPRSAEGKIASSRNSLQHGLASGQVIIPGEDPAEFEALLNDLLADHQPSTTTEELLVQEMAQSHWLTQRALRFQNECFTADGVDEKRLALFLRYQTTHERAFHKALTALVKLQKERRRGFVSQSTARSAPEIGFVSQNAPDEQHFGTQSGMEVSPHGDFVRQNQQSEAA